MIRLGVLFGGRSGEHEISLMSAASVINAIDKSKYEVVQIGITREGEWYLYEGPLSGLRTAAGRRRPKQLLLLTRRNIVFPCLDVAEIL